jgi:hypothetical protein
MQALTLPASRGWHWLYDGFRIFRKNQLMLTLLVLAYWMLMALVNSIPVIGQIAATVCIPALSVSLMNACRMIEQAAPLNPQVLFSGFNENLRVQLVLGAIYLIIAVVILGISALIDGGALFHLFLTGRQADVAGDDLMLAAQFALFMFAPLMMAYWYAPVLVAWHGLSAGKALFFSFVACARNWRAFLVYSLAVLVAGALVPGLALAALSSFISDEGRLFPIMLTMLIVFIVLPTLYASFYVSYRDVFVSIDDDV